MADHNDPNAVNTIFSDIDVSAADAYDMFGYPGAGTGEVQGAPDFTAAKDAFAAYYDNNEQGNDGFFPIGAGRTWHTGVHLWAGVVAQVALVLTPFAIARALWPSPVAAVDSTVT